MTDKQEEMINQTDEPELDQAEDEQNLDVVEEQFEEDPPRMEDDFEDEDELSELSESDAADEVEADEVVEPSAGAEQSDVDEDYEPTMETVIEAVLFASDEPVSVSRLANVVEAGSVKQIRECVKSLNEKYRAGAFSFRIEQIAGGYQMMTLRLFNHWLKQLMNVRTDNKLSPAALETLAIISYKQPIIRADVEAIRGVASGEVIRNLMYKRLVKIVGKAEVLGRPMLYGTTKKFLEVFGLNTLKDLPQVEELKRPG